MYNAQRGDGESCRLRAPLTNSFLSIDLQLKQDDSGTINLVFPPLEVRMEIVYCNNVCVNIFIDVMETLKHMPCFREYFIALLRLYKINGAKEIK